MENGDIEAATHYQKPKTETLSSYESNHQNSNTLPQEPEQDEMLSKVDKLNAEIRNLLQKYSGTTSSPQVVTEKSSSTLYQPPVQPSQPKLEKPSFLGKDDLAEFGLDTLNKQLRTDKKPIVQPSNDDSDEIGNLDNIFGENFSSQQGFPDFTKLVQDFTEEVRAPSIIPVVDNHASEASISHYKDLHYLRTAEEREEKTLISQFEQKNQDVLAIYFPQHQKPAELERESEILKEAEYIREDSIYMERVRKMIMDTQKDLETIDRLSSPNQPFFHQGISSQNVIRNLPNNVMEVPQNTGNKSNSMSAAKMTFPAPQKPTYEPQEPKFSQQTPPSPIQVSYPKNFTAKSNISTKSGTGVQSYQALLPNRFKGSQTKPQVKSQVRLVAHNSEEEEDDSLCLRRQLKAMN